MTTEQRLAILEEKVRTLEQQRMTQDERAAKERQLRELSDRLTSTFYDHNPEAWKRLMAHAGRLEQELGL